MVAAIYCDGCKLLMPNDEITSGTIEGFWREISKVELCQNCKDKLELIVFGMSEKLKILKIKEIKE